MNKVFMVISVQLKRWGTHLLPFGYRSAFTNTS